MISIDGDPLHVPDDWTTVELSHDEIQAERDSGRWHSNTSLDYVVLHMMRERGIRVRPMSQAVGHEQDPPIERPSIVINHSDGITVHQGPRPPLH